MIANLQLSPSICLFFILLLLVIVSAPGQESQLDPLSCQVASSNYPPCIGANKAELDQCSTFAVLRTNSYYSSLYNLSSYLGIAPSSISQPNGFAAATELLPSNQPLLIPIDCRCNSAGGFFEADLSKTTVKGGESFYGIAQSLEGLTTCKAIQDRNPTFSPWNIVGEKQLLLVPLRCACPTNLEISQNTKLLLSYPVSKGDTLANLALRFSTTPEKVISVNINRSGGAAAGLVFKPECLVPFSTLLIPAEDKPKLDFLANLRVPTLPIRKPGNRASKMRMTRVYIAIGAIAFVATLSIGAAFLFIQWRRKNQQQQHGSLNNKNGADLEMQQLSLSVRTTSEKKVSFEGSNDDSLNRQQSVETASTVTTATAKKTLVETYSLEDLSKATEDFSSTNLIEDSVFHGRLNGKNLAIKGTSAETISKIEFVLFNDAIHHHPNIIRLLGTCCKETDGGSDFYLIFEYAKNGSLKDWLHGGLAMKSQFIASCYCFLSWSQRLRICLDVATALHFMHQVMNPPYVHRNIKSRNVFLDEEFNAKVGNFGMARCVEEEQEQQQSGYLSPEYVGQGLVSPGVDVFAFGVVLLEVLSGQKPLTRPNGDLHDEDHVCLSEKIKMILRSEDAEELREWMDKALGEKYSFDAAVTLANLARACVEDDPCLRPNAGEIVDKLSRLVEDAVAEGDEQQFAICESSSKPLVKEAGGGGGSG